MPFDPRSRTVRRLVALGLLAAAGAARADEAPKEPATAPAPAALTRPPRLRRFIKAPSPPSLLQRGGPVDVILSIDIDDKGAVTQVAVAQSGGVEFDEAAVAVARQFEFEPGYAGTTAVPVRITYRYRFELVAAPPASAPAAPGDDVVPSPAPIEPAAPAAESVPFEGIVYRKGDRTAVPGATVEVELGPAPVAPLTTLTDNDGRFHFDAVPIGERKVRVGGPGLQPSDTRETFRAGKKLTSTYFAYQLERFTSTVRGRRLVKETVEQTLDVTEISRIPGTQGDTLKAVQNLPGVARAPFGGGQLIVWGSRPGDTRIYIDNVYIPTLYHFAGLRAVLPTESVQGLSFAPGGYGVEHGWVLGGTVLVDTAAPRRNGYHGFVQLDFIDGSFRVEGPITKKLDFAVSARRSWIDAFLPLFTPNEFQLSPVYYDYQAKLRYRPTTRDDLELFIFGSDDTINVQTRNPNPNLSARFNSHIYFHRVVMQWLHRFDSGAQLALTGSVGYDVPFQFGVELGNNSISIDARMCPYSLRATYRTQLRDFARLDLGLDFEGRRWGLDSKTPGFTGFSEDASPASASVGALAGSVAIYTHQLAPWAALNFSLLDKRLTIVPGLRVAFMFNDGNYDFSAGGRDEISGVPVKSTFQNAFVHYEPRLSARYQFIPQIAIKAALGFYSQPPGPQTLFGPLGNVNARPETSVHYVAGFDINPYKSLSISMEAFYKELRNIVVSSQRIGAEPPLVNEGIGRVYGAEVLVRQELLKGFFGWVSYTVLRSERKDHPNAPDWRLFQYDQTHILTIIASYKFPHGYQLGLRFRYVTGNPDTPVLGGYVNLNSGNYNAIYGPIYSDRLAEFHQLDLRFDKKWTLNRFAFSLYLDVQNVYNAANPEGYQYSYDFDPKKRQPVAGIPFFPALGLRGEF